MTDTMVRDQYSGGSQEIALSDISRAFSSIRTPLLLLILACGVLGVTAAFVMTPVFRATVLMAPARLGEDTNRLRGLGSQFGSLAAFAGVSYKESARNEEALAILKSRLFMERFIESQNLLPVLFEGLWDEERSSWDVSDPADIPSLADGIQIMDAIR